MSSAKAKLVKFWRDWGWPAFSALLLTQFGATAVRVDGVSMLPALRHGEWLALPKAEGWAHRLGFGSYRRGDIVVFKPPREARYEWTNVYRGVELPWAYRPYLIKRVVGLPGDTVQMRQGRLYVNGQPTAEPRTLNYWTQFCHDRDSEVANTAPLKVPAQHYFVVGDNRSPGGSLDSRTFGPVSAWDIESRAIASVLPLARKAELTPACDGQPQPQERTSLSGPSQWNPRWLSPATR